MFCRRELGKALPSYGRISSSSLTLHCNSLCITHIILQFTSHYNPFYIKLHMNRLGSTTSQDSMTSTDSMGWMTALACWKKAETGFSPVRLDECLMVWCGWSVAGLIGHKLMSPQVATWWPNFCMRCKTSSIQRWQINLDFSFGERDKSTQLNHFSHRS